MSGNQQRRHNFTPHPYGVLPGGNASVDMRKPAVLCDRFGQSFRPLLRGVLEGPHVATELKKVLAKNKQTKSTNKSTVIGADVFELCAASYVSCSRTDRGVTLPFNAIREGPELFDFIVELAEYLPSRDLCCLAATNVAWYVVLHSLTDIWRKQHLALREQLSFTVNWKTTVATVAAAPRYAKAHSPIAISSPSPAGASRRVYSDQLFQSWLCTTLPCDFGLTPSRSKPGSYRLPMLKVLEVNDYTDADVTSVEGFRRDVEVPNLPAVLRGACKGWAVFKALNGRLDELGRVDTIRRIFSRNGGDESFRCESFLMTAADYVRYAAQQSDERPIYLFDAKYADHSMDAEAMYTVPRCFSRDDYFGLLGEAARPNYRWLIAGPKRGGSSFHVDPNFTSAWNACLTGRKRWLLFPPNCPPPGVFPSEDMSDVTTPVSLTEWLLNYYDKAVQELGSKGYEVICEPGDIMFVPCGWWHFVINLEDSVAITQNYVSACNLGKVLRFLKHMKGSISGVGEDEESAPPESAQGGGGGMSMMASGVRKDKLRDDLIAALRKHHPDVLDKALAEEHAADDARRRRNAVKRQRDDSDEQSKIEFDNGLSGGFTFSF